VPRILLVDDDIAEISAVKRVLLRAGHQAVLATNSADALAAATRDALPVAVVSAACENGGGANLARRLLSEEPIPRLRVILLGESPEAPAEVTQIPRPVDPGQLAEELRIALASPPRPPLTPPPAHMAALSRGSNVSPGPAPGSLAEVERLAAAEALRRRAEELRGTPFPSPPAATAADSEWQLGPPAHPPPGVAAAPGGGPPRGEAAPGEPDGAWERAEDELDDLLAASLEASGSGEEHAASLLEVDGEVPLAAGFDADELAERELAAAAAREAEEAAARELAAIAAREAEEAAARELAAIAAREAEEAAARELAAIAAREAEEAAERELAAAAAREAERQARLATEQEAREREARARRDAEEAAEREAAVAAAREAEAQARRRALALAGERRARAAPPAPEELPPPRPPALAAQPAEPSPVGEPPAPDLVAGSLEQLSMPALLARAARSRLTGRLDFTASAPRSLFIEGGRVVGATSGAPHERVEEVALRLGLLTREQHRLLGTAVAGLASRRAALLLLERGFLKTSELTALVRRRTEEVVFALFEEQAGRFAFAPGPVPPEERVALERGPLALALEGVRRRWHGPRLDEVLGGPDTLLAPAGGAPAEDLGLSPGEQRLLDLADGLRTLDEILASGALDAVSSRQCLAGLVLVGALEVRHRGGAPAGPSLDLARAREKLEQVRRADYFAILGLSRRCTPHEIREAADRLSAEFDPLRFEGLREPELPRMAEEIRRVVAEAREVLSADDLRREYLAGLGGAEG